MKFLGTFKVGDTIRYSVNFHNDANTTADPANPAARHRKPDNTYAALAAPVKLDGKTGWYGGSIDTTGFAVGSHEVRISGTVDAHEVGTIISFEIENHDADDIYARIPSAAIADYRANVSTLALEANVEGHAGTALTDYDPPTRGEATTDKNAIITEVDANETKIDNLYNELLQVPKEPSAIYYLKTSGDDAKDGLTPGTAKKTFAGAMAVLAQGDMLCVRGGDYGTPAQITCDKCTIIFSSGVKISSLVNNALEISGSLNTIYCNNPDLMGGTGKTGLTITGSLNVIHDAYALGGKIGYDIAGESNVLHNCREGIPGDEADMICFRIRGYGKHRLEKCIAQGRDVSGSYPGQECKGFVISAVDATCEGNILIGCHSERNSAASFDVQATTKENSIVNCSQHLSDGTKIDNGTNTAWINFRVGSQILAGNASEQDSKDIHDRIPSASIDEYKADVSALAIEANVEGYVDASLVSYDPPTATEMLVAFAALNYPTAATIADAIWDEVLADHQSLTTFGGAIRVMTALLKQNIVWDNTVFDANGNIIAMRIRLFDTATETTAATDGGTGEGEFLILNVTGSYTGGNLDLGKVVEA